MRPYKISKLYCPLQNDERCNGFLYYDHKGGCTLLVLSTFFLSSPTGGTTVFYNTHTTTTKTIPVEMAQSLRGFWTFTELGSKIDLSGNKQPAYWSHSPQFWPAFTPGFVQGVSGLYLSPGQNIRVGEGGCNWRVFLICAAC